MSIHIIPNNDILIMLLLYNFSYFIMKTWCQIFNNFQPSTITSLLVSSRKQEFISWPLFILNQIKTAFLHFTQITTFGLCSLCWRSLRVTPELGLIPDLMLQTLQRINRVGMCQITPPFRLAPIHFM